MKPMIFFSSLQFMNHLQFTTSVMPVYIFCVILITIITLFYSNRSSYRLRNKFTNQDYIIYIHFIGAGILTNLQIAIIFVFHFLLSTNCSLYWTLFFYHRYHSRYVDYNYFAFCYTLSWQCELFDNNNYFLLLCA
jgi:hypothetical protein